MRKALRIAVQVAVTGIILWALFRKASPGELLPALRSADLWPLLAGAALVPGVIFLRAYRWHCLLRDAGARNVGLGRAYGLCFLGVALNLAVPGGVGELGRAYFGHKATGTREEMLTTVLIDKLLALFVMCVLGGVAAAWVGQVQLCAWAAAFAVGLGAPVFFPRLIPWRLANWLLVTVLRKKLDVAKLFRASHFTGLQYARSVAVSALATLVTGAVAYLVFRAFVPTVGVGRMFAVWPFFTLVRLVPITFGGFGTTDSVMVFLLGPPLHPGEAILMASLTLNALLVLLPAAIGLLYFWTLPRRAPAQASARASVPVACAPRESHEPAG